MATVVTALPKRGTIGQTVTFNGYDYQWTGVGWKNLGVTVVTVGGSNGTSITGNGVTTGNTSVTSNGVSVGNVALSNTGVNVGNVTLSNAGVNVGNVALSNTGVNVGNVSLSNTGVNVGNVTLSNTGVNVGNVTLSNTGVNVGNVALSNTGVNVGNVSLSDTGVNVGNVTLSNTGVNVGNVTLSDTGVNVGNVTLSNTGVNVGNVTLSDTGVNVGNVTLSNTGVNVGNVSVSNAGVNVGNVTLSNTGVNVGNVSLSNSGVNVGNVSLSNSGVNVGTTTLSNTGLSAGNTSISDTGVNVGNVTLSNTGVNVGNVTLSNTGVNVGNVSLSNTGVNVGNVSLSDTGVNVGNVALSNTGVNVGNVSLSDAGVNVGSVTLSNTGLTTGNTSVTSDAITTGNLTVTTIIGTGNIDIGTNYFIGNGRYLTGVAADTIVGTIPNLTATGNINFTGSANITLGDIANINLSGGNVGEYVKTDGNGAVSYATVQARFVSNVTSIVAGSALDISVDYSNVSYPAGIFTLTQLGPVTLNTTTAWASGGFNKNAYANFIANNVNTQNVAITLSLANATFDIKSSDTITIGGSIVTGANLTGLGISNTGGTYTIPSSLLTDVVQTQATNSVSVNLTTNRVVRNSTGTTLTNNQPIPFNVTAISGTFGNSTVPYWSLNQTFNWNATTSAGATGITGNVTYANSAASISGSLTSSGATSGTSTSVDSTYTYTLTSSDYDGTGGFGAGKRTIPTTVTGTVNPATKYYPLFWKTTSSSTIPDFTTSDSRNSNNFTVGQSANTTATSTNYLWMATPNNNSRTFKHIFLGSDIVDTPDVTGSITISGQAYRVWGFTNFSAVTAIITTS